jgi:hypothetical protein
MDTKGADISSESSFQNVLDSEFPTLDGSEFDSPKKMFAKVGSLRDDIATVLNAQPNPWLNGLQRIWVKLFSATEALKTRWAFDAPFLMPLR